MFSLTFAYLINEKWYPLVTICISLNASEVDHLFMHLLANWISSTIKGLFISFIHHFLLACLLYIFLYWFVAALLDILNLGLTILNTVSQFNFQSSTFSCSLCTDTYIFMQKGHILWPTLCAFFLSDLIYSHGSKYHLYT